MIVKFNGLADISIQLFDISLAKAKERVSNDDTIPNPSRIEEEMP